MQTFLLVLFVTAIILLIATCAAVYVLSSIYKKADK